MRMNIRQRLMDEHLSILSLLYGHRIEEGISAITDYGKMTMQGAQREIYIRTLMLKANTKQLLRRDEEEQKLKQDQLLEQLKRQK